MSNRRVTAIRKNKDGDIIALCNSDEFWSPRYKNDVIDDIENKIHSYYVMISNKLIDIQVVNDPEKGKYLRTDPGETAVNNLEELPDCWGN